MMGPLGLRVAVLCTLRADDALVGRALMLAHAVAASGGDVHLITDTAPDLAAFDPLAPGGVSLHRLGDPLTGLAQSRFDWVIVVPPVDHQPGFAAACGAFLAAVPTRVAVLHRTMPSGPHDPRQWDDARRLCLSGALVLSDSDAADRQARAFYAARDGRIRFEAWRTPVNTLAARGCLDEPKDGSILAILPDGATDAPILSDIPPDLLSGRTLRVVGAERLSPASRDAIAAHVATVPDAVLEWPGPASPAEAFRRMAAAQAVLCPATTTAADAAYAGTESVCFPAPDLREAGLAAATHVATGPLAAALAEALRQPPRQKALRAMVEPGFGFDDAALRLADILLRGAAAIPAGPPRRAPPAIFGPPTASAAAPVASPYPPRVIGCRQFAGDGVLATLVAPVPPGTNGLRAEDAQGSAIAAVWRVTTDPAGAATMTCHLMLPDGGPVTVTPLCDDLACAPPIDFQPAQVTPADPWRPTRSGIESEAVAGDHRIITGWVVAQEPLGGLFLAPDCQRWFGVSAFTPRPKIMSKHGGYPVAKIGFELRVPLDATPHKTEARLLCVARDGTALDLLVGWPPLPAESAASPVGAVA
ncbi:hypothetical protein ACQW02_00945 [Humitalea sp. 24SJ18S-53]|uniref:hypothetical protein n=1 Tax=Humitalea sp. 24SJ18S-53 TaxID=3422307 RepID=UPI003D66ECD2